MYPVFAAHSLARQNDSGLGLAVVPDSSAGSSQDTGSPRSTYSGSSIASGPPRQPVRRLKVPGLDKMENGSVSCHTLDERQVKTCPYFFDVFSWI